MAQNRYVSTNFWKDNYVVELDPTEKLIFIYLLTNPKTNIAGAYEINLREVAFDTGFDVEVVRRAIDKFMAEAKIFYAEGYLVLKNWIKHQAMNPKIRQGIDRHLHLLPDWLTEFALTDDEGHMVCIDFDSLSIGYGKPLNYMNMNSNSESESELESELKPNVAEGHDGRRTKTKQIDNMFDYWSAQVGYTITSKVKQNREYAGKLLNEYSREDLALMIQAAALASEDQYAPSVSDFIDLYRKWDRLKLWGKKKGMNHAKRAVDLTI